LLFQAIDSERNPTSVSLSDKHDLSLLTDSADSTSGPSVEARGQKVSAAVASALDNIAPWLDKDKTKADMVIHRKRTATQVCRDSFDAKVRTLYCGR
jgi:hypothetical protein